MKICLEEFQPSSKKGNWIDGESSSQNLPLEVFWISVLTTFSLGWEQPIGSVALAWTWWNIWETIAEAVSHLGSKQGIFTATHYMVSRWLLDAMGIKSFQVWIQRKINIFVLAFLAKALRLTWIGPAWVMCPPIYLMVAWEIPCSDFFQV